jgi:O-antigen/teichoic acid export membrane protein
VAVAANLWLIPRFGIMGAAFGILLPYVVQGILRYGVLRYVFKWPNRWKEIAPPILSALVATAPAIACRIFIPGIAGQILSALVFLAIIGAGYLYYSGFPKLSR